jgi:hypothetical protein
MALLHQIQESLLDETIDLAPALLKFKFLASKLGSEPLEDWIHHEMQGYPAGVEIPDYRVANLTYTGNFANSVHQYTNHPIPAALILQHTSEEWLSHDIREGMSAIDHLTKGATNGGKVGIDVSGLLLVLQGKIYERMVIQSISASFPITVLLCLQTAVRTRLLDLTIAIEKRLPASAEITIGTQGTTNPKEEVAVTQIFHQTVYGDMTNVASSGSNGTVNVNVTKGESRSLQAALQKLGFDESEANELVAIAADEKPDTPDQPFGAKARAWIGKRISKGADGVLAAGGKVTQKELVELFQQFYDRF